VSRAPRQLECCKDRHHGAHPVCPRCGTGDTGRVRRFGLAQDVEWVCLRCGRRWDAPEKGTER